MNEMVELEWDKKGVFFIPSGRSYNLHIEDRYHLSIEELSDNSEYSIKYISKMDNNENITKHIGYINLLKSIGKFPKEIPTKICSCNGCASRQHVKATLFKRNHLVRVMTLNNIVFGEFPIFRALKILVMNYKLTGII